MRFRLAASPVEVEGDVLDVGPAGRRGTVLNLSRQFGQGAAVAPLVSQEPEAWRGGYAVRRDWPDGTHELVGFRSIETDLDRFIARDRSYWRRGPLRPRMWTVVVVSRRDFDLHAARRDCRSPDCPHASPAAHSVESSPH